MVAPSKLISRLTMSDETLFRLNAYLSTFSGTDKALMLLQYAPLLLMPLLPATPNGKALPIKPRGLQQVRAGLQALSSTVGDSRTLLRLFGLIPILAWHRQLRRKQQQQQQAKPIDSAATPSLTKELLSADRIQSFQIASMLAFYPLEHLWYLASKGVYPVSTKTTSKVAIWSCRAWAVYVLLALVGLQRDRLALRATASSLTEEELKEKTRSFRLLAMTNLSYLPLTAHWSLEGGLWSSSWFTGLFGTLAAVAQLQAGWRATAPPAGAAAFSQGADKLATVEPAEAQEKHEKAE